MCELSGLCLLHTKFRCGPFEDFIEQTCGMALGYLLVSEDGVGPFM